MGDLPSDYMTTNKHNEEYQTVGGSGGYRGNLPPTITSKLEFDAPDVSWEEGRKNLQEFVSKYPNRIIDAFDSAYLAGLDAASNQIPTTDVSWEREFDSAAKGTAKIVNGFEVNTFELTYLKSFIRKQIDLAYDAGGKTVGGTGRVMFMKGYDEGYAARGGVESEQKQRMLEAGKGLGRKEAIAEVKEMLKGMDTKETHTHFTQTRCRACDHDRVLQSVFSALEALSNK